MKVVPKSEDTVEESVRIDGYKRRIKVNIECNGCFESLQYQKSCIFSEMHDFPLTGMIDAILVGKQHSGPD